MSNVVDFQSIIGVEDELWQAVCDMRLDGYGRRDILAAVRDITRGDFEVPLEDEPVMELYNAVSRARRHRWTSDEIIECAKIECSARYDED